MPPLPDSPAPDPAAPPSFAEPPTSSAHGTDGAAEYKALVAEIRAFREFGEATRELAFPDPAFLLPVFVNEFWTSKQRAAARLHEISYRACFKPQLPRFFIERLTKPGEVVYDPFMGRGTTLLEAALLDRVPAGCDINPLSRLLLEPRLSPPEPSEVAARLAELDFSTMPSPSLPPELETDLLVFYHPKTLRALVALRTYLLEREAEQRLDATDRWIRMVATNRLTGHSKGFFSVYTLPPNQATSAKAQRRINERRSQTPTSRELAPIILKKSRSLLGKLDAATVRRLCERGAQGQVLTSSCDATPAIEDGSVALVVTSPPFLKVVDYEIDNWLRCWFNGIDSKSIGIWQLANPAKWTEAMQRVFVELSRVLRPGGRIAFEVGEVNQGRLLMETLVVPAAIAAGLKAEFVLVNDQVFTKTANCWGVENLTNGTNTNRIVVLRKG